MSFDNDNFCAELRAARARAGISQYALAVMVGVTPIQVGRWEQGSAAPRADNVYRLCKALNIAPNELLGWIED